jgi:DNA-directed RNA polymerase specialized sigma24 family protein
MKMASTQEMELIEACAHNDREAQKAFFDRYGSSVMGICVRYSGGEKDAEGMALHVFKKLLENIKSCPLDSSVQKWIEDTVIWNAVKYLHQDKQKYFIAKTTRYVENKPVYTKDIDEVTLQDDVGKRIYLSSLQGLTPSYRILYNLTFIDEVPREEIIKRLEIGEETYRKELDEAKYQFRKLLTISVNEQNIQ